MRPKYYLLIPFILFSAGQAFALPDCPEDQTQRYHNCFGTYTMILGKYVGEFRDHLPNGQGTLTGSDGYKYVGGFRNGEYDGQGTLTYGDGYKYVGEHKEGLANGQGTWTLANGDQYVGGFNYGLYHGQGTMTYVSGRVDKGLWIDGKFQGE